MGKQQKQTSNYLRNATKPAVVPVSGKQTGQIPAWVEGNLYRNGPGLQTVGPDTYDHLFDGLAVLHRFEIKNGKATYQSRYLESDSYKKNIQAQRIVCGEFGTVGFPDPCKSLLGRFMSYFSGPEGGDNCNVNVAFYGDQLYAMTETNLVRRVNPKTLETDPGQVQLSDHVAVNHATAHPHTLADGSVLNMGNNYKHKGGPHYCIIKVPPTYESDETSFKNAEILAEIPMRWKMYPCYYHSFGMTTNKIVFVEQPYCISVPKLMTSSIRGLSFRDMLDWYPKEKTRIHIISLKNGERHSVIYETTELMTFHHANAYEEDGHIVLDLCGYDSAEFVNHAVLDTMRNESNRQYGLPGASLRRYILPLEVPRNATEGSNIVSLAGARGTAKLRSRSNKETIVDVVADRLTGFFEFPRINYKYNGEKYRYVYGVSASEQRRKESVLPEADKLVKYDLLKREEVVWENSKTMASEPVFIPNPNSEAGAEDDGVLLSALLHRDDQTKCTLLVLDAKTMKELATVEFKTNGPVPGTFHGQWAQEGDMVHTY